MDELSKRQYLAISIKHTQDGYKYGFPVTLWGNRRTKAEEKRCYSGYTANPYEAELYSIAEFREHYGTCDTIYKYDEPIKLTPDFIKKYKRHDTVFVKESIYLGYCQMCDLKFKPPGDETELKRDEQRKMVCRKCHSHYFVRVSDVYGIADDEKGYPCLSETCRICGKGEALSAEPYYDH